MRRIQMVGQYYGRLVVLDEIGDQCTCKCDCGSVVTVQRNNLRSGNTQSCGCYQRDRTSETSTTHGKTGTLEFRIWQGMMARCYNRNVKAYSQYGGMGVIVGERWHDFENFLTDMGLAPSPKHTIDRFPNKGGNYELGNCRWATMKEQGNNRKSNVVIEHSGKAQTMRQWEEELGLSRGLIYARLKLGWSVERALGSPRRLSST